MDDQQMTFGRYRGTPLALVPVEYLAWAAERMQSLPGCVMAELTRRAEQRETRDALIAQAAISSRLFPQCRKRYSSRWSASHTRGPKLGKRKAKCC